MQIEREVGTKRRGRYRTSTRLIVSCTEDGGDGLAKVVVHTVLGYQQSLALDDRDRETRRLERRIEILCEIGEYGA